MKLSIEINRTHRWTLLAVGVINCRFGLIVGPIAISARVERSDRAPF